MPWSGRLYSGSDPSRPWTGQSWSQLLPFVERWARETEKYARTPDLWDLGTAAPPDAVDNSPFIQAERDEIAKRLDEIHDFVREKFELRDDQVAAIGQAVEELKEASERVGRKDWRLMFLGAFVSLGFAQVVSSGVVDAVFRLAVEGLGHIFGPGSPPMITA